MRTDQPRFWMLLCLLSALALPACSREGRPPLHPVRGTVTFQKRPAVRAVVVLRPVSPGPLKDTLPHGEVQPDGSFRVGTFAADDGAPAGEYIVTITWPEVRPEPGGGESMGGDRLGGRYSNPAKSPWRIQITEGGNALEPFRLD